MTWALIELLSILFYTFKLTRSMFWFQQRPSELTKLIYCSRTVPEIEKVTPSGECIFVKQCGWVDKTSHWFFQKIHELRRPHCFNVIIKYWSIKSGRQSLHCFYCCRYSCTNLIIKATKMWFYVSQSKKFSKFYPHLGNIISTIQQPINSVVKQMHTYLIYKIFYLVTIVWR